MWLKEAQEARAEWLTGLRCSGAPSSLGFPMVSWWSCFWASALGSKQSLRAWPVAPSCSWTHMPWHTYVEPRSPSSRSLAKELLDINTSTTTCNCLLGPDYCLQIHVLLAGNDVGNPPQRSGCRLPCQPTIWWYSAAILTEHQRCFHKDGCYDIKQAEEYLSSDGPPAKAAPPPPPHPDTLEPRHHHHRSCIEHIELQAKAIAKDHS